MAKMLSRCPVCEAGLNISELSCPRCRTRIAGEFDSCRFCQIAPEHLSFVETFLRCEGNLSRVEKELGVSYPTVRNRLTAALAALNLDSGKVEEESAPAEPPGFGFAFQPRTTSSPSAVPQASPPPLPSAEDIAVRRRETLEKLARGEISAEDAANTLKELS